MVTKQDILAAERSRLRPDLDVADGAPCYVVDSLTSWGPLDRTLWLDPRRGFLPVRIRCLDGSKEERCYLEYATIEAAEFAPGLWFPVRGRLSHGGGERREIALDATVPTGHDLRVNVGVDDGLFDLWRHLPSGVRVWDEASGTEWVTGRGDMAAMARAVGYEVDSAAPPTPSGGMRHTDGGRG